MVSKKNGNAIGLLYLRLVFVAYGKLAWSFLLAVELQFGHFCLGWKIRLVFFTYGPPCLEI